MKPATTKPKLNRDQLERRDGYIKIVKDGLKTSLAVAAALMQLRDDELFLETHDTFEEFCQETFGITRSYAYRLIGAAEVKDSLPKRLGDKITNERQARALAQVPEQQRADVIREAAKDGPLTEATIRNAAESVSPMGDTKEPIKPGKPEKPIIDLDKTGYPIPARITELWKDAEHILGGMLRRVSEVRTEVRKAMESGEDNPIWRGCSLNSVMVALDNAYREINAGIPYGVCPYCQGQVSKTCRPCNQTGYIGKFGWGVIPKEILEVRSKSCKAK